jgi:hypothetical protein
VSGQLHAPAALPRGGSPQYPLDRRLGGPHTRSGRRGEECKKNYIKLKPAASPQASSGIEHISGTLIMTSHMAISYSLYAVLDHSNTGITGSLLARVLIIALRFFCCLSCARRSLEKRIIRPKISLPSFQVFIRTHNFVINSESG